MYRILTGLCCAVWCAVIAVEAFGLNKRQEMALDSFEMASCFNDEFTDDVTAQIRLYGTGPALTSEEEITEYLEGAAAVCQIYSGYGIIKKKETYGCIWELEGANEDFSWSLQYLRKNNAKAMSFIFCYSQDFPSSVLPHPGFPVHLNLFSFAGGPPFHAQ